MQYAALVPAALVQPYAHMRVWFVSPLLAAFEVSVAIAAVCVLPFGYGAANLLFMSAASAAFAALIIADGKWPARNTWTTHTAYGAMGKPEAACRCGCAEIDAAEPFPPSVCIARANGSFGLHLAKVDAGHSSVVTRVVSGRERPDYIETMLQTVGYGSRIVWCAVVVMFGGYTDVAGYIDVVALTLVAVATLPRVPVNLKTQVAYIRRAKRNKTVSVHFLCVFSGVMSVSFSSVVLATRIFATAGDIAAYVLLVVVLPFVLCAFAPATKCDMVHASTPLLVHLIQEMDLYLFPWWYLRVLCECAWWTWTFVLAFAGSPVPPSAPLPDAEVTRVVFSSISLAFATLLAYDSVRFTWPLMRHLAG